MGKSYIDDHDAFADKVLATLPSGTQRLLDMADDEKPDRSFRACRRNDGTGRIPVDMPLARIQVMAEIRKERDVKLVELDTEWRIAFADDNNTALNEIAIKRQTLKDIPQTVDLDAIKTTDGLTAFEPTWPE